jgi:hypothetical protein
MRQLESFYNEYKNERNIFTVQALCKHYKVQILATTTNHDSLIVRFNRYRYYVTNNKIEQIR